MCDSGSDGEELMPKVFAIDDTGEDVDLNVPPTSGQEYLRRVVLEAKKCPTVVVASIDPINVPRMPKPVHAEMYTSLHPAPQGYAATSEWQRLQVADFAVVRQKLLRYKAKMKKSNITKRIPLKENVTAWCTLCFGRLSVKREPVKRLSADAVTDSVEETSETDSDASSRLSSEGGTPPLLSIVAFMDQPTVVKVLEYHINWFEKTGFTIGQGQWFYALLVCLEKPLEPESCSLLRNLARNCATLRATLDSPTDKRLTALNLLICLVAQYFDQSDLADTS